MKTSSPTLEDQVAAAVLGDGQALQAVVAAIKDDVYGLAMRMLWHPADAEDATQEVLIRVCTSLASFEGRAQFRTWVYRVAVRSLLNHKRGRAEPAALSFEAFGADLAEGLDATGAAQLPAPERALLEKEVRIGCTQAMLLCLDRDHRMAYLLGEIVELEGRDAAGCLQVPEATYRKRLSRARSRVVAFMQGSCGLLNRDAPCRCARRIAPAMAQGRVDPQQLLFAEHATAQVSQTQTQAVVDAIGVFRDSASALRANPRYAAPAAAVARLLPLFEGRTSAGQ